MSGEGVHRELIVPEPAAQTEARTFRRLGLTITSGHVSWLELHRSVDGAIRYYLGAASSWDLQLTFASLTASFPGAQLGGVFHCPVDKLRSNAAYLLMARQWETSHFWPIKLTRAFDRAGMLIQSLASTEVAANEVVLQLLFRAAGGWEHRLLGTNYDTFLEGKERFQFPQLSDRRADLPFHVEMRAGILGPEPKAAHAALWSWVGSWRSSLGTQWWTLEEVKERHSAKFVRAFAEHDITRFRGKKPRRDISGTELSVVLPIPWRDRHPELHYAGAPAHRVPTELVVPRNPGRAREGSGVVVGDSSGQPVRLPSRWNHLAILGKTRSGKSTLAENVVLQLLANEPRATVVILEPTGSLIQGVVDGLPLEVAADTAEIDPSHPTFDHDGVEVAELPLNLVNLTDRRRSGESEYERRAERISGDLLQSIKNAWGEESIGGRAEFVLRAVLQSLLAVEGTNLVDAYAALSEKKVLQRLERLTFGTELKNALKVHLPKLDYSFTISSLDKVGKVATNPLLRKTLCQRYHAVSFDTLLERRLVLLNLAKGALGTESSRFLGAILLTQLWAAIQQRPRSDDPIYLVVDEFHNFAIPAFADMLSEGSRLGLHVIAITQYLSRIPDRVRSAMVGNVDNWAVFTVGAEDANDVSDVAQAPRFGWRPDHFTGGLGTHQLALVTKDSLLKIDSRPPLAVSPEAADNRVAVRRSTRRYSRPEDSEESPLGVSAQDVVTFLGTFREGQGVAPASLAVSLGWSPAKTNAAIALCLSTGDIDEGQNREGVELEIRDRGLFHLEALQTARNEGEEHSSLLADVGAFLRSHGVHMRVLAQEGGYLRSDAEFEWGGRTYSVEVECSTLVKQTEQVVRNVRKALAAGRRVLTVVSDRDAAELFAATLKREISGTELWDQVGLVWRQQPEQMVLYEAGPRRPWGFLTAEGEPRDEESSPAPQAAPAALPGPPSATSNEADIVRVLDHALELLAAGKTEVSADDFAGVLSPNGGGLIDRVRLGMALESLGVSVQRKRVDGSEKVRIYDLTPLSRAGGGPTGQPIRNGEGASAHEG